VSAALPVLPLNAGLHAQMPPPNIIVVMGDDIGWSNIGACNQGIISGRTPNLDRLATEGMRFTGYYAEASCTAGRENFITGELPIRTELTTVDRAQVRRVFRLPVPPGRDGGPIATQLPAGAEGRGRPAQHGPFADPAATCGPPTTGSTPLAALSTVDEAVQTLGAGRRGGLLRQARSARR
jgi:hypothetical protein